MYNSLEETHEWVYGSSLTHEIRICELCNFEQTLLITIGNTDWTPTAGLCMFHSKCLTKDHIWSYGTDEFAERRICTICPTIQYKYQNNETGKITWKTAS